MRDDEIVAIDAEPAAGVHHFVGGGGERHRAAELAAEIERQEHVLLLQRHVGERHLRHLAFQDERSAIAEHRRRGDALEDRVDRDLARDAAFFGERDRFAEADHLDHQQQVDRDLHLAGKAVAADMRHLRADREQHRLDALEGGLVAADHHRGMPGLHRDRAARERPVEHDQAGLGEFGRDLAARRPARWCSCRCRCRPCAGRR